MVATPIDVAQKYVLFENRAWCWVPAIASKVAPTRAELDAGTDVSPSIQAVNGFSLTTAMIDTPTAGSDFTSKISGRKTVADSNFVTYLSLEGPEKDCRSVFTEGDRGFVVIFTEGDHADGTMDVWPVIISSSSKDQVVENAATLMTTFATTSKPAFDLAVPAHA